MMATGTSAATQRLRMPYAASSEAPTPAVRLGGCGMRRLSTPMTMRPRASRSLLVMSRLLQAPVSASAPRRSTSVGFPHVAELEAGGEGFLGHLLAVAGREGEAALAAGQQGDGVVREVAGHIHRSGDEHGRLVGGE